MGKYRPLIGLQTRGVLVTHRMHPTVEAAAADHLKNIRRHQSKGPYLLAGYSGGAFHAFEMARQLRAAGEVVDFLGILDTSAPKFTFVKSGSIYDRLAYSLRLLRGHGPRPLITNFTRWLQNALQPDAVVRAGAALQPEKFRHIQLTRHWWKTAELYDPAPYEGDACLFLTASDLDGFTASEMRKADPDYGWHPYFKGTVKVIQLGTDHLSMLRGAEVRDLADMIEAEVQPQTRET